MNNEKKAPVLTLEHLSSYLPYCIRVKFGKTERNLTAVSLDSPFVFVSAWKGSREREMVSIEDIKPILRPISDLTKEIEHKGKKFVPLVELFCVRYVRESFDIVEIKDNYLRISWDKVRSRIDTFMYSESTQSFVFINQESGKQYRIPYQLGMFKKMHSWYFDVDDLIGCELAIDINSIEVKDIKS